MAAGWISLYSQEMLLPEIQAGYYYSCSAWLLMGLSRISVYSPFIFINDLGDITDDTVTNLANDRGWKRLRALWKAGRAEMELG